MTTNTYNGWKNRATWNTALWLTNDEGIYRTMLSFFGDDGCAKSFHEAKNRSALTTPS